MATGEEIETRGHVIGFREEIAKAGATSGDLFFTWFDDAADKQASFVRGSWDFALHIAQPAAPYLQQPQNKVALEIGHGGGRLLAAASRAFGEVVGVDIHNNNALVEAELRARGVTNFRLLQTEGSSIPMEEQTIDFVYSFIVLQHVERYSVFKSYLADAARVLKPGGVAVIYFGRKVRFSYNRTSPIYYWADRLLEGILLSKGYAEVSAKVNEINLQVALPHAVALAKELGFVVHETLVSHRNLPDGIHRYGRQNGLVLTKGLAATRN